MSGMLSNWFAGGGLAAQGDGSLWLSSLPWIYLVSDAAIAVAYYGIAAALIYIACKRERLRYKWMFVLFSSFLFACGSSYLTSALSPWYSGLWLGAVARVATVVSSAATAVLLWWLIPRILRLPTSAQLRNLVTQLEHEIAERSHVEEALCQSQETLRELAAYQERIREDERKRIAREIHDELGQTLLALRLEVSMLHARAGERHPRLKKRAELALEYIDATMKSIRTIMNNLRPSVLDLGVQAAIEWQVKQFEQRNGIPCELSVDDEGLQLDDEHATAVFRILQESLTNIGRHSRASIVRIGVRIEDGLLRMDIEDNGVGMYPGDRRKARRFGLIGIQERASMLGGELTIESTPGQGTVLHLKVPLEMLQPAVVNA
ncbi:sensor histidine kinase [Noviherbaspirillum sp. UKPF54]|uniref:sensor histidine kinase n=1 Tax=Noviherbaspirillum sp. UKPF54 TaxID=2601898 RepID=UPI0011B0F622|nr:sensor histidine kinase [Noviherbaspirillum sp. UKPF54]QDZ30042.1 sensor histidine kinase [Noviherbaspirillum sp. UKPF54]